MSNRRQRFAARRKARGYSQESFAEALKIDRTTVQRWERGGADPQPWLRPKIAGLLGITSKDLDLLLTPDVYAPPPDRAWSVKPPAHDDEFDAYELARRIEASDVGAETLNRLECAFDELAVLYPVTPPQELLERVRRHSAYIAHLTGVRATLSEHRRLLVVGGWFSLLGATLHIDLDQQHAATARLSAAAVLAPMHGLRKL